jgi:phosphohistidine phosphatase
MAEVVIMRHGHAMPTETDPDRGLSETGRYDSIYVADQLAAEGVRVQRILHSGKKRAAETAEILTERVGRGASVEKRSGLDPNDTTEAIAAELAAAPDNIAIVGHLPHLEILLVRLLGKERAPRLGTSSAVHIARDGESWTLVGRYAPHR